jgi:hypothetical protein
MWLANVLRNDDRDSVVLKLAPKLLKQGLVITSSFLTKYPLSNNVGRAKCYLSLLVPALRRARDFALGETFAFVLPTQTRSASNPLQYSSKLERGSEERKLLRMGRGNFRDQDPVASLFFRPEKSSIRRCEEFHCCCSVLW